MAALAANMGIAVSKFVAYAFTGSASMLAEGVHSRRRLRQPGAAADRRQAGAQEGRRRASVRLRPRAVRVRVHRLGGAVQPSAACSPCTRAGTRSPTRRRSTAGTGPSACWCSPSALEGMSFRTAVARVQPPARDSSWIGFIRRAKAPELPVVLLEDFGALLGLAFALFGVVWRWSPATGVWDGVGTLAIGVLLVCIAVVLAVEMKSLLVGEGAGPARRERDPQGGRRRRHRHRRHPPAHDAPRAGGTAGRDEDRGASTTTPRRRWPRPSTRRRPGSAARCRRRG